VFVVRNGHFNPPDMKAAVHLSVFLLYFAEIITLLAVETKRCYHGHLDRTDDRPSPFLNMTEAEMLVFLAIAIQLEHCIRDRLIDYWANN
jgi:hypothetical protein